jgi:hypothetical protein
VKERSTTWNNYHKHYPHLMPAWTTLKDKDK